MMRSFQSPYFQLLCLLIAALLECKERPCKQVLQLNISHLHGDCMSISCQSTTHLLDSLTVKLSSINPVKDILMYPDISPASEHQRWSVRKDDGNFTLDLKDIRLSDGGLYDCQVYKDQDCLHSTQFYLSIIQCKILNSVHATLNSQVLLPCSEHPLQNRTEPVTWKVINGHQLTDITQYRAPNKPSSGTEKPPNPLFERARLLKNGSLLIRKAVDTDELWYHCRVNEKTCYEMRLVMKVQLSCCEHLYMMRSFQSPYFQLLCLLIAALLECKERPCKQVLQLNISHLHGDCMSISCQSTTHLLDSLTVKLSSINPVKDILMYPDISPASEHQRWSVRKDDGNFTLDLKDIRLSDGGLYDCQVYKDQDCLHSTQFYLSIIQCKILNSVHATLNSQVLLPCSEHPLQNRTEPVTWKVINGHQLTDITQYRAPNKPSSGTEKPPNPLFERARLLKNGSLLIRKAVDTDELWYHCRVNEKTCYEMRLVMKAHNTSRSTKVLETLSTTLVTTASADSLAGLAENNSDGSETVTTNLTVVVMMTTVVSLCVLISLTICVILYFKKQRRKTNSQTQLNSRISVYYSHVAEGFDVPLYSLVEQNTGSMITFGAAQSEAPACKADNIETCEEEEEEEEEGSVWQNRSARGESCTEAIHYSA
ncbi:uncharacterized protein [Sinocyclocheilus grahami]|uniref:uncharacterized protein n=1 Tax=Sinocyclocheilus grahami TaxID=75366 RepID=UPI0007AC91B1|nr:PREDICTED: uncharacterized protein LOC107582125 [Sinocyclocheilus grahami]